jgi:hypothetical protein
MPFLHCRQLECLRMIHIDEFCSDLLESESPEDKETYHHPLLELAHRVTCTFDMLCNGSASLARGQSQDIRLHIIRVVLPVCPHRTSARPIDGAQQATIRTFGHPICHAIVVSRDSGNVSEDDAPTCRYSLLDCSGSLTNEIAGIFAKSETQSRFIQCDCIDISAGECPVGN